MSNTYFLYLIMPFEYYLILPLAEAESANGAAKTAKRFSDIYITIKRAQSLSLAP